MSGLHENQKAMRKLKSLIKQYSPKNGQNYFFILGFPRSDIGKGTLVAQMLAATPNSNAIKFDGLLNTNGNGRHTARGHDDFGIYERFNKGRSWGNEHYILGGELYLDFIKEFGELENLQINPHLSLYLEYRIHKMWFDMGSPKNLFIEIGGVLSDPEVEPLFAPIIQRMSASIGAKTILLSETSYNGEFIKTKAVQDGVKELSAHQITPWLIVAREPEEFKDSTASEHIEFERVLSDKLYQNTNIRFGRVFSVPFYKDLTAYTNFINQRFLPLITPSNEDDEIVIATSNDSKYADYLLYLGDNNKLVQGSTLPYKIDIPEGTNSVEDNAIAKARAASIMTNRIAIGDDIGFFIEELYGEPGVALRRWGGELGDSATNANFWEHLQKKTKKLVSLKCYFEQCVAIVSPRGDIKLVYNYNHGTLNRNKLKLPYNNSGYPLGAAFESTDRNKTWDEMSNEEKKVSDKTFIDKLRSAIDDMKNL